RGQSVGDRVAGFRGNRPAGLPGKVIGRRLGGLHSNDPYAGLCLLDGGAYAANQRGIAHGNVHGGHGRKLLQDFEADRGRTGRQVGFSRIIQKIYAVTLCIVFRQMRSVGQVSSSSFDNASAEFGDSPALDLIGVLRKENGGSNAELARGPGHRSAVIAGAGGNDLSDLAALKIRGESKERASRLEGAGGEVNFEFQISCSVWSGKGGRGQQTRRRKARGKQRLGSANDGKLGLNHEENLTTETRRHREI